MKIWDRVRKWIRRGPPAGTPLRFNDIMKLDKFNDVMEEAMRDMSALSGLASAKPEPICPLTKQLIVQQLSDLAVKHPASSIRNIISAAMEDGVKDDHELLENLTKLEKAIPRQTVGFKSIVRYRGAERDSNDMHDALSYAMRGLVDNMKLSKIRPALSGGCVDPVGKSGSSSG